MPPLKIKIYIGLPKKLAKCYPKMCFLQNMNEYLHNLKKNYMHYNGGSDCMTPEYEESQL